MLTVLLTSPQFGGFMAANLAYDQGRHGAVFLLAEALFVGSPANTIFEIEPDLAAQLLATDFSRDQPIPARFCRLPVELPIFVHVPSPPDALAVESSEDTLPLCGYYLREAVSEGCRTIEIIAVSCPPVGDTTCNADNYLSVFIEVANEDEPLSEMFERADQRDRTLSGQPDRPELRSPVLTHLAFVTKLLVYLGMREARQTVHLERTEAIAAAQRLGPRKREGALRRAERLHDFVRIAAAPSSSQKTPAADGRRVALPHHRRGHFRVAHVGEGRMSRRIVWIRPTLVNRAPTATSRHYAVS